MDDHAQTAVCDGSVAIFLSARNSNIHRAAHELAARVSDAYESAREKMRSFLNATYSHEITFVHGATESINLVAHKRYVSHLHADVKNLGCDWYLFSGHKVFGPTGIDAMLKNKGRFITCPIFYTSLL